MKMPTLLSVSLLAALSLPAAAQTAPPQDVPFEGSLKIDVDATDLAHRIFKVRTTMPAKPGPMTLLYPQWIPGNHSPTGPIDKLAGLVIKVDGKVVPWTRDQFDVYAFKIDVPQGATELVAEFKFLSPQASNQGRVMMTPEMLNLQWNTTALYPAGVFARNIKTQASVTLPKGWDYATALETQSRVGDTVTFKPIDFDDLVDSPMFAGKYYKRVELSGGKQPVYLNVFADEAKSLDAKPEQIKAHAALVQQMDKLYGARHFDHYEFLLALTKKLGGIGLERPSLQRKQRRADVSHRVGQELDRARPARARIQPFLERQVSPRRGSGHTQFQRADGRQPAVVVRGPDPVLGRSDGRTLGPVDAGSGARDAGRRGGKLRAWPPRHGLAHRAGHHQRPDHVDAPP